jgi:hypothetical protein
MPAEAWAYPSDRRAPLVKPEEFAWGVRRGGEECILVLMKGEMNKLLVLLSLLFGVAAGSALIVWADRAEQAGPGTWSSHRPF